MRADYCTSSTTVALCQHPHYRPTIYVVSNWLCQMLYYSPKTQQTHGYHHSHNWYDSHQVNREILDPIFSVQVHKILASSVPTLNFISVLCHATEIMLYRICERDFIPIPVHFCHATMLPVDLPDLYPPHILILAFFCFWPFWSLLPVV